MYVVNNTFDCFLNLSVRQKLTVTDKINLLIQYRVHKVTDRQYAFYHHCSKYGMKSKSWIAEQTLYIDDINQATKFCISNQIEPIKLFNGEFSIYCFNDPVLHSEVCKIFYKKYCNTQSLNEEHVNQLLTLAIQDGMNSAILK